MTGAVLSGATRRTLGYGYQFLDDVADVVAGVAEVGKERGKDLDKYTEWKVRGGRSRSFRREAFRILSVSGRRPIGFSSLSPRRVGKRASPRRRAAQCRSAGYSH